MRSIKNDGVRLLSNPTTDCKRITPKIEREVEKLCALGPRPLLEFLREIDRGADVFERLAVYAALPAEFLRANDADRFLPVIFSIEGGR